MSDRPRRDDRPPGPDAGRMRRESRVRPAILLGILVAVLAVGGWQLAGALRDDGARVSATPTPDAAESPAAPQAPAAPVDPLGDIPARGLALGITEPNPALVWSPAARPEVPAPFQPWREVLGTTRPALYRLMVSWRQLQPRHDGPVDLDAKQPGCLRDRLPCAPWSGVREQLAALAARQREGGWEGLVVLLDTPDWAAQPATGCEPPGTEPRARAPRADALAGYRAVVRALLAAAAAEGATLRYWSAWNEPNHPYFLASRRAGCDGPRSEAASSPAEYARIVGALDEALGAAPGARRVLGELAAITGSDGEGTGVEEFIAALPRRVVCGSPVFTQHAYAGGRDPVPAVARALSDHGCPAPPRIWITETGAGRPGVALSAGARSASRGRACRDLHERLSGWWEDPRVDVAVQYTLREDDLFRVGLVRTDLSRALPTLAVWRAWSARPAAQASPPSPACPTAR